MRVSRARISGSKLSRLGARWVTTTKAMPGSDGMALNKCSSASTPPAEAPTPTMGNGLSIGSPARGQEETVCLWRVARAKVRQAPANSKRLCRLCNALLGRFGARQKLFRPLDRVSGQLDFVAKLRNLVPGHLDQLPRLHQQSAVLEVHRMRSIRSGGVTAPSSSTRQPTRLAQLRVCDSRRIQPDKLQLTNGYFGSFGANPPYGFFSMISSMRKPARRPSIGSSARSIRNMRRAAPSPTRLHGWKPPLSG